MKKRVKVRAEKTVYTFAYLRAASWHALQEAKKQEEGRFYQCMTSQLFSAFCLEAYINHIGSKKLSFWENVEKKLGPKEKLEIIAHEIGYILDYGKRPFQSFDNIFKLRNLLVHGRTESFDEESEQTVSDGEIPILPKTKWQNFINIEMAEKFSEDTKSIIESLNSKAGFDINYLYVPETSMWSMSPIEIDSIE